VFNSKLLIILFVNIALFSASIWSFADKSKAITTNAPLVESLPPLLQVGPLNNIDTLATERFHFPRVAPFPSKAQYLQLQLTRTQQSLDKKHVEAKIAQKRALRQQASLQEEQRALRWKLSQLNRELDTHKKLIVLQNKQIERLQVNEQPLFITQTEVDRVRESIDNQPNLIKSKESKLATKLLVAEPPFIELLQAGEFSGSMEFGYSYEQDNQIIKGIDGRLILDYDLHEQYNINSDLDFEFEDEDGDMTTGKYRWQLQSDYNLDATNLVYARSDISRSKFSSYDKEQIFTVGYGRIFFNNPKHKLNIEVGPGYRFAVPNLGEEAVSIDEFIARTRVNYERVINENLQVKMDSVLETGHSNSVYGVGFKAQKRIYQQLYLTFEFEYKFTQNVPVDTVNDETSSGLSLLYAF